ncbi:DUF1203 domain-containing protein [Amycolatopsis nigrescens]|uniref:DUF1203 domain-containing protein n=1 Tax=Amycolatopsis nigrescens TaxID=381445 RepID=UPI00035D489E|nr:DUF1203 domain-containing protein [Amycolatopsis nigrescens]
MTSFRVNPIPAATLDLVRRTGLDASANPVQRMTVPDGETGWPLRCCLRDAAPGEELILFGYEQEIGGPSPYRQIGAVFAHERDCGGAVGDGYPAGWLGRPQAVRSYDERGWILESEVHDGVEPAKVIEALLADPGAVRVHSHNLGHGCFMFEAVRD